MRFDDASVYPMRDATAKEIAESAYILMFHRVRAEADRVTAQAKGPRKRRYGARRERARAPWELFETP